MLLSIRPEGRRSRGVVASIMGVFSYPKSAGILPADGERSLRTTQRLFIYTVLMIFDWAKRMQIRIAVGIILTLLVVIGGGTFAFVYRAPSCLDQKQNQDEKGVDCGGKCTYLCTAQVSPIQVLLYRSLSLPGGRTDVIAYIQNPNRNAQAKRAPYTLELYAADATILVRMQGFIDIPAGALVPLYIRAAAQGSAVTRAFVSFDPSKTPWTNIRGLYTLPRVSDIVLSEDASPRVTAKLSNELFDAIYDVRAVAVVFDSNNTAIAASETLVPVIRAQSSVPITFTWNESFTTPADRVEVMSTVLLP